jgi:hypothetical protein
MHDRRVGGDLVWGRTGGIMRPSSLARKGVAVRQPQGPGMGAAFGPAEAPAAGGVTFLRLAFPSASAGSDWAIAGVGSAAWLFGLARTGAAAAPRAADLPAGMSP